MLVLIESTLPCAMESILLAILSLAIGKEEMGLFRKVVLRWYVRVRMFVCVFMCMFMCVCVFFIEVS